jgi:hypothetical protein
MSSDKAPGKKPGAFLHLPCSTRKMAPGRYATGGHFFAGQATSATIYRKLPYNVRQSFQTVGLITDVPMTLFANDQPLPIAPRSSAMMCMPSASLV